MPVRKIAPGYQHLKKNCNPVVSVSANQEKRFEVLKKLAQSHGFEIYMLAEENTPVTMEKRQRLSRVVESITRDMSVVLKYKKIDGCETLVAVSVLEKGAGELSGGARIKQYSPEDDTVNNQQEEYQEDYIQEERESGSASNTGSGRNRGNSELEGEEYDQTEDLADAEDDYDEEEPDYHQVPEDFQVETSHSVGGKWKYGGEMGEDIRPYVEDVVDGLREPNIDVMSDEQRAEFERVKREVMEERGMLPEE